MQRVDTPYRLRHDAPKVSVSSTKEPEVREAVLIACQRRPDTRPLVTPHAACPQPIRILLSDGDNLFLTEAMMADRTKFLYGAQIMPDAEFTDPREVEQRAVAWLQTSTVRERPR